MRRTAKPSPRPLRIELPAIELPAIDLLAIDLLAMLAEDQTYSTPWVSEPMRRRRFVHLRAGPPPSPNANADAGGAWPLAIAARRRRR